MCWKEFPFHLWLDRAERRAKSWGHAVEKGLLCAGHHWDSNYHCQGSAAVKERICWWSLWGWSVLALLWAKNKCQQSLLALICLVVWNNYCWVCTTSGNYTSIRTACSSLCTSFHVSFHLLTLLEQPRKQSWHTAEVPLFTNLQRLYSKTVTLKIWVRSPSQFQAGASLGHINETLERGWHPGLFSLYKYNTSVNVNHNPSKRV